MRRKRVVVALVALLLAIAGLASFVYVPLKTATGLAAHSLCSFVFVSGLDVDTAWTNVDPISRPLRPLSTTHVDREQREVSVDALGIVGAHAVYREQIGCTLVHESSADALRAAWTPRAPRARRATGDTPSRSTTPGTTPVTVDSAAITRALDAAFADPAGGRPRNTMAVVVVRDGVVIGERYAPGVTAHTPLHGWSMTKSVYFALTGILVREGKLDVKAPAPIAEWRDDDDSRRAITIEQLLRMTSGLALPEKKSPFDAVSRMLFHAPDMAAYAAKAQLEELPGARWEYTSGDTLLVARAVRDVVGGTLADQVAFAEDELFAPLGITTAVIEADEAGTLVSSSYMHASARDWARLGELYLADGVWNGQRLLPEGWMTLARTPTPGAPMRSYGAGFWLNMGAEGDAANRKFPALPAEAFYALGFQGQYTFIVPSKRLVIVRLGYPKSADDSGFSDLAAAVLTAIGES